MIPPTSIDGTDITVATIDGTDVQEITVDGDVVFSAEPALPSSMVHRYKMNEGSGTTISDSVGSHSDGNLNGAAAFIADAQAQGGFVVDNGSGNTGDDIRFSTFSHFTSNSSGAMAVTAEFDSFSFEGTVANLYNSTGDLFVSMGFGNSSDEFGSFIRQGGSNNSYSASNALSLNTKQRMLLNYDLSNLTVEFFVNGVQQTIDGSNFARSARNTALLDDGARDGNNVDASVDDFILYNQQLTQTEVDSDYQNQPWS